MKAWRILLIALAGLMLLGAGLSVYAQSQTTIYVDNTHPNASDTHTGMDANAPVRTIARALSVAISQNQNGIHTTVLIAPGTYREAIDLWAGGRGASLTIQAEYPGTVHWSGAEVWSDWQQEGSYWVHHWPYDWGLQDYSWEEYAPMEDIMRRKEMILVGGSLMKPTLSFESLQPGSFYVDEAADRVYVWPSDGMSLDDLTVEVAVLPYAMRVYNSENVTIRGIVFQHVASAPGDGALTILRSENITIDNSSFVWNNWGGIRGWNIDGLRMTNVVSNYNGQSGFSFDTVRNLFVDNTEASYNNWRGAIGGWYLWSAGNKFNRVHGGTITNYRAVDNHAFGLWLDFDNENLIVDNIYLENNLPGGLFIEASQGPITVRNSVFINNNDLNNHWSNGGVFATGSNNVTLECNYFEGNEGNQIRLNSPYRSINNWETNESFESDMSGWVIKDNLIVSENAQQMLIQLPETGQGALHTMETQNNIWWNPAREDGFHFNNTGPMNLPSFVSMIGHDEGSIFGPPDDVANFFDHCSLPSSVQPTPTVTFTPTFTATNTPTNTVTPTFTPTNTPTNTATPTFTATNTPTNTVTPTFTATNTPTNTVTPTFTATNTPTNTVTPTFTATDIPTEETVTTQLCAATTVVSYLPGQRKNGSSITRNRRDPNQALGMAENDDTLNFVALGFGGSIILEFAPGTITNIEGNDFRIMETTFNDKGRDDSMYPEQADVYASQDGNNWVYLGLDQQDMSFDLGQLDWVRYIKLVDSSDPALFDSPFADGFDLDAVEANVCNTVAVPPAAEPDQGILPTETPTASPIPSATPIPPEPSEDATEPPPAAPTDEPIPDPVVVDEPDEPASSDSVDTTITKLDLVPLCPRGKFRVDNPNNQQVSFTWKVPTTTIAGRGVIESQSHAFFNTQMPDKKVLIYVGDKRIASANPVKNCAPTAVDDYASTNMDVAVSIPVLNNDSDSDGDVVRLKWADDAPNGTVTLQQNGSVTYQPDAGFSGTDHFVYTIHNGATPDNEATATVYITVNATEDGGTSPSQPVCDNPDPERDLRNDGSFIQDPPRNIGQITNTSDACSYPVGMATYKMVDNIIDNQIIFDWVETTIQPGETITLSVALPDCATQVDLFYGPHLPSLDGVRYGVRILGALYIGWYDWCVVDPPAENDTIAKVDTKDKTEPVVTEEPTAEPTAEPVITEEPTVEPTAEPVVTEEPTVEPTAEPVVTEEPTAEPTAEPVVTEEPTVEPTAEPIFTEEPVVEPAAELVITA